MKNSYKEKVIDNLVFRQNIWKAVAYCEDVYTRITTLRVRAPFDSMFALYKEAYGDNDLLFARDIVNYLRKEKIQASTRRSQQLNEDIIEIAEHDHQIFAQLLENERGSNDVSEFINEFYITSPEQRFEIFAIDFKWKDRLHLRVNDNKTNIDFMSENIRGIANINLTTENVHDRFQKALEDQRRNKDNSCARGQY